MNVAQLYTDGSHYPQTNKMKYASCLVIDDNEDYISENINVPIQTNKNKVEIGSVYAELYSIQISLNKIRFNISRDKITHLNVYNDNESVINTINNYKLSKKIINKKRNIHKSLYKSIVKIIDNINSKGIIVNVMWVGETMNIPYHRKIDKLTRQNFIKHKFKNL